MKLHGSLWRQTQLTYLLLFVPSEYQLPFCSTSCLRFLHSTSLPFVSLRTNFVPTSYQLRTNCEPTAYQLSTNFVPTSYQLCTNSVQLRTNFAPLRTTPYHFVPTSYQLHTSSYLFVQLCINFVPLRHSTRDRVCRPPPRGRACPLAFSSVALRWHHDR